MLKSIQLICISLLMISIACSSPDLKEDEQKSNISNLASDEEKMKQLSADILDIIEDKSCNETTAGKCKAIAFGSKACGGPATFLIYNSGHVDESLLIEKVKAFNKLQVEYNKKAGIFSDCMVVGEPVVGCVDGACAVVQ
jgi:hypothetical protein